jgi:hypothetical protein
MKKLCVSLLAAGLLFGSIASSNAATVFLKVTDSASNNWLAGIPTTNGDVTSLFSPLNGGLFLDFTVPPPNGFVYGSADQLDTGGVAGTWDPGTEAWFDVIASLDDSDVSGDATEDRRFTVKGLITGSVDAASSTAVWQAYEIFDVDNGVAFPFVVEADPISGTSSLRWDFFLSPIVPVNMWVEGVGQTLNRVGIPPPTSIEGSVSSVPEPGTLALLVGFGVSGSLLFRRRK